MWLHEEASPRLPKPLREDKQMKLTQKAVAALQLDGKTDLILFDDELPRFGVRLRRRADDKVDKSYIVQWKRGGQSRRIRLGSADLLSPADARAAAREKLAQVDLGKDPAADRRDRRAKDALTMRSVVTEFLAAMAKRWSPRTLVEGTRYLTDQKYFGPLHAMPLDTITLRDVSARIVAIQRERGDPTAARARGALVTFFGWAMRMGLTTTNPCIGSINPQTTARERVLDGDELVAIWKACANDHFGKIVRLLILTGCRRSEIGDMAWSELDFEKGVWTLPAARAKTGKARVIPLLPMLRAVIDDVPRMASRDQLFGGRSNGFKAWHLGKVALDQRCGVAAWTLHDVRRSVATHMAEQLAAPPHIVELVLGHEFRTGVQARYNRAPYEREIRHAYLRWHEYLRTLLDGGARKVVPIIPHLAS
jgi:integrase